MPILNSGRKDGQGGGRIKVAESVVGGLVVNHLVNGSRLPKKKTKEKKYSARNRARAASEMVKIEREEGEM